MIGIMAMAAAGIACPARHGGAALHDVAIFDGPLAEQAMLAPDTSRRVKGTTVQTWRVANVYRAGRTLNVRCGYAAGISLIVPVPEPVRRCRLTWRGRARTFDCA